MATSRNPRTVRVTDDTDLSELLDAASAGPIQIERDGVIYQLAREDADIWSGYDPERVLAGIDAGVGAITPKEADRLKEAVYRAREDGTRPAARP